MNTKTTLENAQAGDTVKMPSWGMGEKKAEVLAAKKSGRNDGANASLIIRETNSVSLFDVGGGCYVESIINPTDEKVAEMISWLS